MDNPLISVILIVRNGEVFLSQAIESVIAQTYPNYELIVVDGQSQDRTAEIAKSFPQARYIYQEGALGVAHALNLGVDAARGEFIAFIANDDIWMPEKLQLQIEYLQMHPETGWVVSHARFFLEPGHQLPKVFRAEFLDKDIPQMILETLLLKKTLFQIIGRFDPRFSPSDDVDFFARLSDAQMIGYVLPQTLTLKRVHSNNTALNFPAEPTRRNILGLLRESVHRKMQK